MTDEPRLEHVRERTEAREMLLSPLARRSADARRAQHEEPDPIRTEYQRDRDRVVHSKAFRRLKHKSQVLIAPKGDHYTTRLTHVMEVSQVGRTIARALNLNEDLVEAAALGHDLGHTPFGHVGEEVLNELLEEQGGFHHSRHSVRIVEHLERGGRGMNLTLDTVEAIRRHSKPRGEFMTAKSVEGMALEAQIVRLSDALAYLMHDINDALRCEMLAPGDFPREVVEVLGDTHSQRVNSVVLDAVRNSWDCTGGIAGDEDPRIRMSAPVVSAIVALREFMFERFYLVISSRPNAAKARDAVRLIWEHLLGHPEAVPHNFAESAGGDARQAAVDYLCGMTDQYAIEVANNISAGAGEGILYSGAK